MSDVTVVGMVMGTHLLEDIGRDVPFGVAVTIPEEVALRSKDLWRAISQRSVMRVKTVIGAPGTPQQSPPTEEMSQIAARNRTLEEENRLLRERLARQEKTQSDTSTKLDSILEAMAALAKAAPLAQSAAPQPHQTLARPALGTTPTPEALEADVPMFIPSTIRPADAKSQIEVQENAGSTDLSGASERLRKLRRNQ